MIGKMFKNVAKAVAPALKKAAEAKKSDSAPRALGQALPASLGRGLMGKVSQAVKKSGTASPQGGKASVSEDAAKRLAKILPRGIRKGRFFKEGGEAKKPVKRAAGSPPKGETTYEVLGRRVTKEQYDEASKEMDRPKSKVEEDMDDFAKQARERAKMKPKKMMSGGMADKTGRAMKKTAADAKGRAMTKAPKKMMGGGMAKYAKGGSVACGPATRGYGAARKSK